MHFVERAVNNGDDNWVKYLSMLWESERVETLDEASSAVAERAE